MKKVITPFFYPLPFSLGLLMLGIGLFWFSKKQKAGKILVTLMGLILVITSYGFFSYLGLSWLESFYPPIDLTHPPRAKWVIVLGGGVSSDPDLSPVSRLSSSTLVRLIEGIRIQKKIPGSKLILSGGRVFDRSAEAELMKQAALDLEVPASDMFLECDSKDTADQARIMKKRVGNESCVLVTSAYHMPRSITLFASQGLYPVPAPTDFKIMKNSALQPAFFFPKGSNIKDTEILIHELLGLLWCMTAVR
ncbi:MAG: YdcF family protein [Candidatus Aureabacteria bacterium]|nr:YdcF family protein [Candidatus Auribacterota bacterium]